jgi:ribosomal protein S25
MYNNQATHQTQTRGKQADVDKVLLEELLHLCHNDFVSTRVVTSHFLVIKLFLSLSLATKNANLCEKALYDILRGARLSLSPIIKRHCAANPIV